MGKPRLHGRAPLNLLYTGIPAQHLIKGLPEQGMEVGQRQGQGHRRRTVEPPVQPGGYIRQISGQGGATVVPGQ